MKRISMLLLSLALAFSLAACGRKDKTPTTPSTGEPTGDTSMIPGLDPTIMDPTIHTNIPDPEVDSSMPSVIPDPSIPDFTGSTDSTQATR